MIRVAFPAALALVAAQAAPPTAPAPDVAGVIQARQAHFKEIGHAAKGVRDELASAAPSVPSIQTYARTVASYAPQVGTWFPRGSGPEAGVKTSAKPDIWIKPADFAKDADAFRIESAAFEATAQKGDLTAIQAGFNRLSDTCKSCHQEFRERDEH